MNTAPTYGFVLRLVSLVLIAGCDRSLDDIGSELRPSEETVSIVAPNPVTISDLPSQFIPKEPLRVVGTTSGLCVSLRGDMPTTSSDAMAREFNVLMNGAQLRASVTSITGKKVVLGPAAESWSKQGKIEKAGELAACMRPMGGDDGLPIGALIASVELTSTRPLNVRGVYWESTNAWDKAKADKKRNLR